MDICACPKGWASIWYKDWVDNACLSLPCPLQETTARCVLPAFFPTLPLLFPVTLTEMYQGCKNSWAADPSCLGPSFILLCNWWRAFSFLKPLVSALTNKQAKKRSPAWLQAHVTRVCLQVRGFWFLWLIPWERFSMRQNHLRNQIKRKR